MRGREAARSHSVLSICRGNCPAQTESWRTLICFEGTATVFDSFSWVELQFHPPGHDSIFLGGAADLLRRSREHWFDFLGVATALPIRRRQFLFFYPGRGAAPTRQPGLFLHRLSGRSCSPPQNHDSSGFYFLRGYNPQMTRAVWIFFLRRDCSAAQMPTIVLF